MYRQLIITIFLTTVFFPAAAQFSFGGKTGIQAGRQYFDDVEYQENLQPGLAPGVNAGLAFGVGVAKSFDLYAETNFSLKSFRFKTKEGLWAKDKLNFSYFDFPVMLRACVYRQFGYNIFIEFGPEISYWIGGRGLLESDELEEAGIYGMKYKLVFEESESGIGDDELYVPGVNRWQLGLVFGVGAEIKVMDGQSCFVDLRYERGHSYMSDSPDTWRNVSLYNYSNNMQANNHLLSLSVAYMFDFQKLRRKIAK